MGHRGFDIVVGIILFALLLIFGAEWGGSRSGGLSGLSQQDTWRR